MPRYTFVITNQKMLGQAFLRNYAQIWTFLFLFISHTLMIRSSIVIPQCVGLVIHYISLSYSENVRRVYEDVMSKKLKIGQTLSFYSLKMATDCKIFYLMQKNFSQATIAFLITKTYVMSGAHYVAQFVILLYN